MRRVFVDANVLIAGAHSRSGASRAVLMLAEVGLFKLVVSRQVLDEVERNIRAKLPKAMKLFVEILALLDLEIVEDPDRSEWEALLEVIEEKDAPILAAAVAAKVDRFITLNTKDFTAAAAERSGLIIQTPAAFIEDVREVITIPEETFRSRQIVPEEWIPTARKIRQQTIDSVITGEEFSEAKRAGRE